jgi:hypothetical protein
MLRVSGEHLGQEPDLRALTDARVEPVTPYARELTAVADAAVLRDADELPIAVERLVVALGPHAAVRTVAVAANFQMMNRMLDAIGVDHGGSPQLADAIGVPFPTR